MHKMDENKNGKAFGTHDIARICNVTPPTAINWIEDGKMPSFTTGGGHRRVWDKDLLVFMKAHNIPATAEVGAEQRFSVLIVEDEPQNRVIISRVIKGKYPGVLIEEAADAFEAGSKLHSMKPTLVIMDIQLPGASGIKICETMRADPGLNDVKILAMTGCDVEDSRTAVLNAGANDFISKPFTIHELTEKLEGLIVR